MMMSSISVYTTSSVYEHDNTIFFVACETEILDATTSSQDIVPKITVKHEPDFQLLRPLFGWILLTPFRNFLNILPSMHVFLWVLF
jgi:hypothetical protein